MARSQQRSQRKESGGRYHYQRTKRKYELSYYAANTKLDAEKRVRTTRIMGGDIKQSLLTVKEMSVADKKGKTLKAEILNVIENPANANLVRRNILTKGCVVETNIGKVRVTSRPGQEGSVNGVLLA